MLRSGMPARALVTLVAAASIGCAAEQPMLREPPKLPEVIHTVCLWPLDSDLELEKLHKESVQSYERSIAEELARDGLVIVDATRTQSVWTRALEKAGGYFDPLTGQRDDARYGPVRRAAYEALGRELGCQGLVRPYLAMVRGDWSGSTATWDGAKDDLEGGAWNSYGTVAALSLWIRIESVPDAKEVYFYSGGVQVLAGMQRVSLLRSEWALVDREKVLADPQKNFQSIRLALAPIAAARGAAGAQPSP